MVVTLDIQLNRHSKVYNENDMIKGNVIIQSKSDLKHDGIVLSLDGHVNLQLSSKTVGIFESFYQSVKPIQLFTYQVDIVKAGKLPAGKTELTFEFPLRARNNRVLYETYHGVFINIQYLIKAEVKRSFLIGTTMQKSYQFIIEYGNPQGLNSPLPNPQLAELLAPAIVKTVNFDMSSESGSKTGLFRARGHLDSINCPISKPFTGEIIIEKSENPIKSIELQLVRVETTGCAEGFSKEISEIQTIQVGDGQVGKNIPIPLFFIFPRLFVCPTLMTTNFKIEFEVNIIVIFSNEYFKSENFPLKLTRF